MHLFDRINRITLAVFVALAAVAVVFAPPQLAVMLIAIPIVLPIVQFVGSRLARTIYDPTGARVPARPGYSAPESLVARGRFLEAVDAYAAAAREEADDPEPWLRIARIERTDLKRPRRALEALHNARARVPPDSQAAMMIGREVADLYLHDLDEPLRAMPELARLAATFAATPAGDWAARELADLKARVRRA